MIDYNETFSPVLCKDSLRIIMIFGGTLRFRITSDGCKDDISQRGLGGKCLHGTTERFCHERKRANGMPPKEIHLRIKTSFMAMVLEV